MGTRIAPLIAAAAALAAAAAGACATRGGTGRLGVRADVAEAPRCVPTPDGSLWVWELELRATGDDASRIEEISAAGGGTAESWRGDALAHRLVPRVRAKLLSDRRRLAPGARSVALLGRLVPAGAAPPALLHDVTLVRDGAGAAAAADVVSATERAADTAPPVALGPPVAGGSWLVENGPATLSGHRRAVVWLGGRPRAAQRFAVDLFRAGPDGRTSSGDARSNASHHAFGAEVLAVADATVAAAVDGIPDNEPGTASRAVEMQAETIAGNHVVLDLGGGRFAMLAHLAQGSVSVKTGDRVGRGRVLGRIGNSGNSTEPHLHLHVADGPSPVDASGLPFVFAAFESGGRQFAGVLPSEGAAVSFGAPDAPRSSSATSGAPSDAAVR